MFFSNDYDKDDDNDNDVMSEFASRWSSLPFFFLFLPIFIMRS